jgi:hypothetical protein
MNKQQEMTRFITILALIALNTLQIKAQAPNNCAGITQTKMLIAGDSWAQYMADDDVFNDVFNMYGHADKQTISSTFEIVIALWGSGSPAAGNYAVSGSEARQWANEAQYPYLQNVRNALLANPDINTVYLSIGGNDILAARCNGGWYKNMDLNGVGSENALLNTIMSNTTYVVNQILAVRPSLKVIISGYDYPNFNVQGAWAGCAWLCNLCDLYACERRKQLSYSPTTAPLATCEAVNPASLINDAGINSMMQGIEQRRQAFANSNPSRVKYDNSLGLMHHYYGDGSTGPGSLPIPQGASPYTSGGNPNNPTLRENFRLVNVSNWFDAPADPIHLTQAGYTYKAKNLMDNQLFNNVMRGTPNATFLSEGAKDGYVYVYDGNSPQSVNSNGIRVGDNGVDFWLNNQEYYGILSFNTASLPDNAVVQGASIYMIRSSADDNPFLHSDRNPVLDIKSGFFGSSDNLQLTDWNAAASANNIGCFNGNADQNNYAVRIDLQPTAFTHVSKTGQTQFRMKFDYADFSTEFINFYDGDNIGAFSEPTGEEQRLAVGNNQYYSEFTVLKKKNSAGDWVEEIIEKSKPIEKPNNYVFEKIKTANYFDADSNIIEQYRMLLALEHPGLGKLMGTKAPFLDIWYTTSSVLPVELISFVVKNNENDAFLQWATATEKNSLGFDIEHSFNGNEWETIGHQKSANNSNFEQKYEFTHLKPQKGIHYYRLKMIDQDGQFTYSEIKTVHFFGKTPIIEVYPNPFDQILNLSVSVENEETLQIQVLDLLGRTVLEESFFAEKGTSICSLRGVEKLAKGTYIVKVNSFSKLIVR